MARRKKIAVRLKRTYRKTTKALGFTRRESKAFASGCVDVLQDTAVNVLTEGTIALAKVTIDASSKIAKSAFAKTTDVVKTIAAKKIDIDIIEECDCDDGDCKEVTN